MNRIPTLRRARALAAVAAGSVLLAGCASFSADGGFDAVRQSAGKHLEQDVQWARSDAERAEIERRMAAHPEVVLRAAVEP